MGNILDTTAVYARLSNGEYHRSTCLKTVPDDGAEPVHELPEDAELADCCSKV